MDESVAPHDETNTPRRGYKHRTTMRRVQPPSNDSLVANSDDDDDEDEDDKQPPPEDHALSLTLHDFPTRPMSRRKPLQLLPGDDEEHHGDELEPNASSNTSATSTTSANARKISSKARSRTAVTRSSSEMLPGHVVYITERLLRKATKIPRGTMSDVRNLNLHLPKRTGSRSFGQIRFVENLHLVPSLRSLNLSYNTIKKMENFRCLDLLRDLNLAENNLDKLESLDELKNLRRLNVSGNNIVRIPKSMSKLSKLEEFRIARNRLDCVEDLRCLSGVTTLRMISVAGNPMMIMSCSDEDDDGSRGQDGASSSDLAAASTTTARRSAIDFVLFALRTIDVLDGETVTVQGRKEVSFLWFFSFFFFDQFFDTCFFVSLFLCFFVSLFLCFFVSLFLCLGNCTV
jgi:hypothetical protein